MSIKTMFAAAVAVVIGATIMITGQSFAASTPTTEPSRSQPATGDPSETPAPTPTARPARPADPVRTSPRFTG